VAGAEAVLAGGRYLAGHHDWAGHLDVAIAVGRREGHIDAELTAAQNLITFHEADGSQDEARRVATAMVERARELRMIGWEQGFRQQLHNLDFHAGRYEEVIDAGYALAGEGIDLRSRERLEQAMLLALVDVGRFEEARARLEWGLTSASPDKQGRWWFEYGEAELELWSGRVAEAITAAQRALASPGLEPALASFPHLTVGWACLELGRPQPAPGPDPGLAMLAGASQESEALRLLADGDAAGAAEQFLAAADAWHPYHRRGELRARYGAGEARRRAGDQAGARSALLDAEERAQAHGMRPLLGRIHRSLRLAGVHRTSTRTASDEHGLTAREREILGLVGEGLSNTEIARRLGVSRSTVAAQLGSASAKLGVAGRVQAAATTLS
jgi:DNA-binding CsgD family transcriptional regulator